MRGIRTLSRPPGLGSLLRGPLLILVIAGPGVIAASFGNDATGIAGYSIAGASYGLGLLWVLPLSMVALIVVQEMAARLGVATGKGLSELIREQFGPWLTVLAMSALLVANASTTVAEFAGIAGASELVDVPRWVAVPLSALAVWTLVFRGTYRLVERVLLAGAAVFVTYIVAGILAEPDWGEVGRSLVLPDFELDIGYVTVLVGLVGTTITPWMPFYLQASIVDKGVDREEFANSRLDVYFGSLCLIVVALFIVVAAASALFPAGEDIDSAEDAARALEPLAGRFAGILFGIGLFNASFMAAAILPLCTAYAVCEAFGFERGVDRSFREAPVFQGLYAGLIAVSALVVLLPGIPLITIIFLPNVIGGILLPFVLILMLRLANRREIMGGLRTGEIGNLIGWAVVAAVLALTMIYTAISLLAL